MVQEMGYQSFDEQLMLSVSDAELDEITVSYIVKSVIGNKDLALVVQADDSLVQNKPNNFLATALIMAIALSIGFAAFLKKNMSSSKNEAIIEMKEGLVTDSQQ